MPAPGTLIERREQVPPRTPPVSVGTAFMAGISDKGSTTEAVKCTSLGDFVSKFGGRRADSPLYDAVDSFFHEGGSEVWISRVTGPGNAVATVNIFDQAGSVVPGDISLVATAKNGGAWGNSLNVDTTVSGTNFQVQVSHDVDGVLETSPLLATRDDAVSWATTTSKYINLALGASNEDPRAQANLSLAGGADDVAGITDTQRIAALNRFTKDLGPGQINIPGTTLAATQQAVLDHAAANNRIAILDAADTPTVATLTGAIAALRSAASKRERFGGIFAPWDVIPGLTPGTTRVVPPSARIMGHLARLAGEGRNGNVSAAGDRGQARYAIGLSQPKWTDAERDTLNTAGVNVSIVKNTVVTTYGWRTLADPNADPNWTDLGGSRVFTQISAEANVVGDTFVFEEIDGEGRVFRRFEGALKGMLIPFWQAGSLYGQSQQEAFVVDTGPGVNTPQTIQAKEINGEIGLKTSPHGELVRIRVSKATLTEAL